MTKFGAYDKTLGFFAGWGCHYFYMTPVKKLFCGGWNNHSQLGLGHNAVVTGPVENSFKSLRKVVDISVGENHTLFFNRDGTVLACGRNSDGRCGIKSLKTVFTPTQVQEFHLRCRAISAGFSSSYILSAGRVYSFGRGSNGQLALGDLESRDTPTRVVHLKEEIKEVLGGYLMVVFITKQSNIFFSGYNGNGQQCCSTTEANLVPVQLTFFKNLKINVKSITLSSHTVFFLTDKSEVYATGHNLYGEYGLGRVFSGSHIPILCKKIKNVKEMYGFGDFIIMYRTLNGKFFGCGFGSYGSLGIGVSNHQSVPKEINFLKDKKICQVQVSSQTTYFISCRGVVYDVYGTGGSYKQQLPGISGLSTNTPKLIFQGIKLIKRKKTIQYHEERLIFLQSFKDLFCVVFSIFQKLN